MLHPSYTEVLTKINEEENRGDLPKVDSRYSIVIATAKRAREIVAGSDPLVAVGRAEKPLSTAVKELYDGKIKIDHTERFESDDELIEFEDEEDTVDMEESQPEEVTE